MSKGERPWLFSTLLCRKFLEACWLFIRSPVFSQLLHTKLNSIVSVNWQEVNCLRQIFLWCQRFREFLWYINDSTDFLCCPAFLFRSWFSRHLKVNKSIKFHISTHWTTKMRNSILKSKFYGIIKFFNLFSDPVFQWVSLELNAWLIRFYLRLFNERL